jgi:hypothetical protein
MALNTTNVTADQRRAREPQAEVEQHLPTDEVTRFCLALPSTPKVDMCMQQTGLIREYRVFPRVERPLIRLSTFVSVHHCWRLSISHCSLVCLVGFLA